MKLALKREDCNFFRTQSDLWKYFEVDSVTDARPTGYKVYLQFAVIVNKTAAVLLVPTNNETEKSFYEFGMIASVL